MNITNQQLLSKISQAQKLKQQGNKYFKQKQYIKSLRCYHQSNLYLSGLIDKQSPMSAYTKNILDQQTTKKVNQLKFSIYMNMAQIYIYQAKYQKGYQIISKAGVIKQNNKLKYRKGIICMNLGKLQDAKKLFGEVLEIDKNLKDDVEQYMKKIREMEKKQDNKAKRVFAKFFEKQEKTQVKVQESSQKKQENK